MKDGSPSVYSPESFTWSMPPYDKDQVLTQGMAEAGFSIQDLLEDVELVSEQVGSSLVETRRLQIEDIDFTIPQTNNILSGIVSIEQSKSTYLHTFSIGVIFPVDEKSVAQTYFKWGVDNPSQQRTDVMVQDFNEEGLAVASRSAMNEGFSMWDRQFIRTVLDSALVHKGIKND